MPCENQAVSRDGGSGAASLAHSGWALLWVRIMPLSTDCDPLDLTWPGQSTLILFHLCFSSPSSGTQEHNHSHSPYRNILSVKSWLGNWCISLYLQKQNCHPPNSGSHKGSFVEVPTDVFTLDWGSFAWKWLPGAVGHKNFLSISFSFPLKLMLRSLLDPHAQSALPQGLFRANHRWQNTWYQGKGTVTLSRPPSPSLSPCPQLPLLLDKLPQNLTAQDHHFFFLRSQTVSVKNLVRVQGKSLTSVQLHLELQLEKLRMMQQLETGIFWGHLHPLVVDAGTHRSGSWCWQSAGTLTGVLPCAIFRDLGFFTARLLRTPVASVPVNRGKAVSSFPSRLWNYHAGFHWLQASRKPTQIGEEDIDPNSQGNRVKQFAIFYFWLPHLLTPSLKGNILSAFKSISS